MKQRKRVTRKVAGRKGAGRTRAAGTKVSSRRVPAGAKAASGKGKRRKKVPLVIDRLWAAMEQPPTGDPQYYRAIKKPVTIRLDMDMVEWFKSRGKHYQTLINRVLRTGPHVEPERLCAGGRR